ncbi:MAG: hypothetical protein QOE31_1118 [Solirubrobacteraceae bacterium]|nr:hypothetical protein [Solirubrobacteraceae bacterium]
MASRTCMAIAIALALAAAALSGPAAARAADPPTILSAGVDAGDRLYVSWSLGAGTTYDRAVFATSPQPAPFLAGFFATENLGASDCAGEPGCTGAPQATSYTARRPVARDRRYFVQVTATAGAEPLTSAVWVIDETKPLIVDGPLGGDIRHPTNSPAAGRLLAPPPSSSLTVLKLPTRIAGALGGAVRVRVRCTAGCEVDLRLSMDGLALVRRTGDLYAGSSAKLVLRPTGLAHAMLRARSRALLRLSGTVTPLGGPTVRVRRSFRVRR